MIIKTQIIYKCKKKIKDVPKDIGTSSKKGVILVMQASI